MTDDGPEYRSRDYDPNHHETYLRHLLDRLADFERRTDPRLEGTAEGKDHRAFSALLTAGTLVEAVAGWAIDHVVGLSLAVEEMQAREINMRRHPEYLRSRGAADTHEHEARGSAEHLTSPSSSARRRLILRNMVFSGGVGLPLWLREEALEAFEALERGEAPPLLQPSHQKRMRRQLAHVRLRLVAIARFRAEAYGGTIDDARNDVASCLGMEGESLKNWEKRLKSARGLGSLTYDREISRALAFASQVRNARRPGAEPAEQTVVSDAERHYGDAALATAVAEWQKIDSTGSD